MHRIPLVLTLLLLGLSNATLAQQDTDNLANFEAQMDEASVRLELSESQRDALEPILRSHFDEVRTLLGKYGLDRRPTRPPGRRQLLELANEIEPLRVRTDRQVEAVLSEQQMAEYRQLQKERRTRMRTRIRRGIY